MAPFMWTLRRDKKIKESKYFSMLISFNNNYLYFRSTFLGITIVCIMCTVILIWFVHKNRRIKVFRIASPTFLIITLIGCIIMYSEVSTIYNQINILYSGRSGFFVKAWQKLLTIGNTIETYVFLDNKKH